MIIDFNYLPVMESLNPRIPLPEEKRSIQNYALKDFSDDVSLAYRNEAAGKKVNLLFYRYKAIKGDTLQSVAARLNIPQETLATANGLESPDTVLTGLEMLLPAAPGLFIPQKPKNALEILLEREFAPLVSGSPVCIIKERTFYFLQGQHFTPTQRAFFLDTSMKIPLSDFVLSSDFGYRISPISKKWKFHSGVDLAAPEGTDVFACKQGLVAEILKNDPIYGNCIILQHANGMTSVYAHLSRISTEKNARVSTGEKIGQVGTTGASTGPHLHFEIRLNGKPANPLKK